MTSSQRIVVNTAAQYTRTVINVCLSLYSTRLILAALGQTDFGIYSVVAGVVAMLSFMTNALVSTTQRYLSYNHGKGDYAKVHQVFGNSLLLHLLIGGGVLAVLAALAYPTIHSILDIDPARHNAAFCVFGAASIMLCMAFITAPFRALFIARENIVYISIIDVLDGILKLLIAIFLTYVASYDKLITYSVMLTGISVFNLLAFSSYALKHFDECHIPKCREWNSQHIKELSGFAGWNIYGTGCIIFRTQGIAIVINRFFGVITNAAYGIAQQVIGSANFISSSILSAMSPQIIKARGAGDSDKMVTLALMACKYTTLMMSLAAIPLIAEMPTILHVWLGEYPAEAVLLCRGMLIAAIVDQWTIGLTTANQAVGKIAKFTFTVNTAKLLSLPAAYICAKLGLPLIAIVVCFIAGELVCSFLRIPFITKVTSLTFMEFHRQVTFPILVPIMAICLATWGLVQSTDSAYRAIITLTAVPLFGMAVTYLFALTQNEKVIIRSMLKHEKK